MAVATDVDSCGLGSGCCIEDNSKGEGATGEGAKREGSEGEEAETDGGGRLECCGIKAGVSELLMRAIRRT